LNNNNTRNVFDLVTQICVTSNDGAKLFLDDALFIDNDGIRSSSTRVCAPITWGVYKLDLEYFESTGSAELILEWGDDLGNLRTVPPRAWADPSGKKRFRDLMIMNEHLERDLENLKETDIMGPSTRAEYNRRKMLAAAAADPSVLEQKQNLQKFDFSKMDQVLLQRRQEQMKRMH